MSLLQLLHHAAALLFGIVEFGEGVAHFPGVAIALKTLDEARFARHFLGEGRDVLREMRDVARLDQRAFHLLFEDEGKAFAPGPVLLDGKTGGLGGGAGFFVGLDGEEVDTGCFLHRVRHRHALERALEGNRLALEFNFGRAVQGNRQRLEQPLHETHDVFVVGIGPIALHHGEFRIVPCGNAFVAEVAVDFEHLVGKA
ncbi:hypothetical protein D3C80_1263530 [compost metagenome]